MSDNWNQPFSMPMFRNFVPEKLRPWIYVYFAFCFQLTGGLYLGAMEQMRGALDMKREDIMMCLYATLFGLALYFPLLFRTKFRFTNRSLLLFALIGIAVLDYLALQVRLLPLLWIICFIVGALKLQGTFECLSNIQLWITPQRDYGVFFPVLFCIITMAMGVSDILAVHFAHYLTWEYMSYAIIGLMLVNALIIMVLVKRVRLMPKTPLLSIDWLGGILWGALVMQIAFVFCYGEYYDWWKSPVICTVSLTALITFIIALLRMVNIHHPYITPKIFLTKNLLKFLVVVVFIDAIMATEHVLENVFFAAGPQWGELECSRLNYPIMLGSVAAVLVSLCWLKVLHWRALRLIAVGMLVFAAYSLWFYFNVSADINFEKLYLPMFLRGFATTMVSITMVYTVKSMVHFMVFFQALPVLQCLHFVIGGAIGVAAYTFGVRYFMGDNLAAFAGAFDATSFSLVNQGNRIEGVMNALQLGTVKQLYGLATYASLLVVLLVFIRDIPVVNDMHLRIPDWRSISTAIRKHLKRAKSKA